MTRIRVVDFETTATEPPGDVIEAGWCDVAETEDGFYRVELPGSAMFGSDRITAETRAIHHISPAEVRGLAPFDAAAFVKDAGLSGVDAFAAHQAEFEAQWIGAALSGRPLICTYKAALRVWPDLPVHTNQFLRYWLEEQRFARIHPDLARPAHRAGPDAYATAHVLSVLLQHATLAELVEWTAEPRVLPRCPLGKWRGRRWSDVEVGFLEWMLRQPTMESDLKWNAQREINRRRNKPEDPELAMYPEPGDK